METILTEKTERSENFDGSAPDGKGDYWDYMMTYLTRNEWINWAFHYDKGIDAINSTSGDWMDVGLNSIKPDKLSQFTH